MGAFAIANAPGREGSLEIRETRLTLRDQNMTKHNSGATSRRYPVNHCDSRARRRVRN
nr:hypothetical protein SHINE37_44459 [Rhizobiaceae bacterium]